MAHYRPIRNKRSGETGFLVTVALGKDPTTGKFQAISKRILGGKREAEAWARKTLLQRDRGELQAGSSKQLISALLDDLLLDYEVNGKDLPWAKRVVERHVRPFFGRMRIHKLTSQDLQKFIAHRQRQGAKNGTINHGLALLRRAYNLGRRSTPPKCSYVPNFPILKLNNARKGFFEHGQYLAMRQALPEEIQPILTFAYFTGCRKTEILKLQWSQVDLLERIVRLHPGETKNEEGRIIPLAPELYEVLKIHKQARDEFFAGCPWVFHRLGQRVRNFRKAWETASKKAGLWDEASGKPTRIFHDLRRSGVRNLIRAGVSERVAMMISGHKTRSILDRYNIVSERDLKEAALRLGEYLGAKEGEANSGTEFSTHSRHDRKSSAVQ